MAGIERIVTAEAGETGAKFTNNVWLVGDSEEVIVIDPARDAETVLKAIAGRRVSAVLLTHGHWDHVRAAVAFAGACSGAPGIWLHPADEFLWLEEHPGAEFRALPDDATFPVAGVIVSARHTPGHTPGSTSFVVEELGAVFSGDTLFQGGPGATRWPYSNFDVICRSIEERLLGLPDDTVVHTGHGDDTTIGAERAQMPQYRARGW